MNNLATTPPWLSIGELGDFVQVLTSTRCQGHSSAPYDSFNLGLHVSDDPSAVFANRQTLRQALPDDPLWLTQVHGHRVIDADNISADETFEADASVTSVSQRVLAIQTADCLPLVVTAGQEVLGVAHAGWRGLANGVLPALIDAMQQKCSSSLRHSFDRWQAWIGPCIGPSAFQVGQEVYDVFVSSNQTNRQCFVKEVAAPHKWRCDLPGLAIHQFRQLGIERTTWCGWCTVTDDENRFFSYRRDGRTGRMATLAWLD